jgi:hypothetical protein
MRPRQRHRSGWIESEMSATAMRNDPKRYERVLDARRWRALKTRRCRLCRGVLMFRAASFVTDRLSL